MREIAEHVKSQLGFDYVSLECRVTDLKKFLEESLADADASATGSFMPSIGSGFVATLKSRKAASLAGE